MLGRPGGHYSGRNAVEKEQDHHTGSKLKPRPELDPRRASSPPAHHCHVLFSPAALSLLAYSLSRSARLLGGWF